ncbi:MAG TPA: 30S ribosomal protein S20 [Victivallales bacterium]|nr:30S ribosomal protein S20 [Victivallales bacterium]
MPASKSAAKRILTSEKARLRNKSRKTAIKSSEKKLRAFVESSEMDNATKQLKDIFHKLDKAVKVGTIHKNKSNRKKSRLAALLKK